MNNDFEFIEEVATTTTPVTRTKKDKPEELVNEVPTPEAQSRPEPRHPRTATISPEMELWHEEAIRIRLKYPTGSLTPDSLTMYAREFNILNETVASLKNSTITNMERPKAAQPPVGAVLRILP